MCLMMNGVMQHVVVVQFAFGSIQQGVVSHSVMNGLQATRAKTGGEYAECIALGRSVVELENDLLCIGQKIVL